MRNDDLALWELSEIAEAIAEKRITSVEATEACLARIEIWQPRVNAFLRIYSHTFILNFKDSTFEGNSKSLMKGEAPETGFIRGVLI